MLAVNAQFSRINIRGKLFRSGHEWPLPIDDTQGTRIWSLFDALLLGDDVELPDSEVTRVARVSVDNHDYWLVTRLTCAMCGTLSTMPIHVAELKSRKGYITNVKFERPCACGHRMTQDGRIS